MQQHTYSIMYAIEETHWWFAGRRRIPGLDHGRTIVLEGVIVDHANRPVIYNPAYTLVP